MVIKLYEIISCNLKAEICKRENEIIRENATINKIRFRINEMKKAGTRMPRKEQRQFETKNKRIRLKIDINFDQKGRISR